MAEGKESETKRQNEMNTAGGLPASKRCRQPMESEIELRRHGHTREQYQRCQKEKNASVSHFLQRVIFTVLGRLAAETKRHAKAVMPNIARARLMICSPDSIALFYLSAVLRLDEYGSAKPQTGGLSKFPDTGMLKVVPLA